MKSAFLLIAAGALLERRSVMKTRLIGGAALVACWLGASCGPPPVSDECIVVDEELGYAYQWCNGVLHAKDDPSLSWNGEVAGDGFAVCLLPGNDGECLSCPVEDASAAVEAEMNVILANDKPECELQHWELGCMRTKESAQEVLGRGDYYCCYEVAVWGPGCEDGGGSP